MGRPFKEIKRNKRLQAYVTSDVFEILERMRLERPVPPPMSDFVSEIIITTLTQSGRFPGSKRLF